MMLDPNVKRQIGYAIAVMENPETHTRNPFAIVYCIEDTEYSRGDAGHNVSSSKVLPQWVRDLTYFKNIFNRDFASHQVIINYCACNVIMISLMEKYEIERVSNLIPINLYPKLAEVGACIKSNIDDQVTIEHLKRDIINLTDKIVNLENKKNENWKYYQSAKEELIKLQKNLKECDAYKADVELLQKMIADFDKKKNAIKKISQAIMDGKSFQHGRLYGQTYYISMEDIQELDRLTR